MDYLDRHQAKRQIYHPRSQAFGLHQIEVGKGFDGTEPHGNYSRRAVKALTIRGYLNEKANAPKPPPNTPMQPTAARTRSCAFWQAFAVLAAAKRQPVGLPHSPAVLLACLIGGSSAYIRSTDLFQDLLNPVQRSFIYIFDVYLTAR